MTTRLFMMSVALCIPLLAPGMAMSAEKSKRSADAKLIPQEVINSKGYTAMLKDGTKIKIVRVRNTKNPKDKCKVDVNSVRTLSIDSWTKVGLGAKAKLSLQSHVDAEGVWCSGKGSGCLMDVEIPDAKVVADKLMR